MSDKSSITVSKLIDTSYREYSLYVLEQRAIPSCIDGLKPVQRKALYTVKKVANAHSKRMSEIGSSLSSVAAYVHGDSSAIDTCVKMAQKWKNQFSLISGEGNFGSRLVQEAAAPRYIYGRYNPDANRFFRDERLAPVHSAGDEHPEPTFYLPLIPWVLVNGTEGIAIGFSCSILPREIKGLVKQCINYLEGKKVSSVDLTYPQYTGRIEKTPTGWISHGEYQEGKRNDIEITELPVGWDRQGYVTHLNSLCDNGKLNDFEDHCSKEGFKFILKCSGEQKKWLLANPATRLGMEKKLSENLTTIDENGKLRIFENDVELIKHFVDIRLGYYEKRKQLELDRNQKKIDMLNGKIFFVREVVKLDLNKTTRSDIQGIANRCDPERPSELVGIPVYECTTDYVQELEEEIDLNKTERVEIEKQVPKEVYLRELKQLLK